MFEKALGMRYTIHGSDRIHSDIVDTLRNLGLVFQGQGNLNKHTQCTKRN